MNNETRFFNLPSFIIAVAALSLPLAETTAAPKPKSAPSVKPAKIATLSKADQAKAAFYEGNRLILAGKSDAAIQKYEEAIRLDSTLDPAYVNLGATYAKKKAWDKAEDVFRRLSQIHPKEPRPLLQLAEIQAAGGQPGASQDTLKKAVAIAPDDVLSRISLAKSYEAQGLNDKAEEQYQTAVKSNPKSEIALRNLAGYYFRRKNPEALESALKRVWAIDSKDPKIAYQIGTLMDQRKDKEHSVPFYKAAVRLDPKFADAWQNLGANYLDLQRVKEADDAFSHSVKLQPGDALAQIGYGLAEARLNRMPSAEKALRKGVKLDPSNAAAKKNLSIVLLRQKKFKDAQPFLESLQKANPTDPETLQGLIYLYSSTKQPKKAIDALQKAISLKPDDSDLRQNLASLYLRMDQSDKALIEYKKTLQLKPDEPNSINLLDYIYQQKNYPQESIDYYQEMAAKNPFFYRLLANVYERQGKQDQKIDALKKWCDGDPKNVEALQTLSAAYESQKKFPEARVALEKALAIDPKNTKLLQAMSSFYQRMGNTGMAEKLLRDAIKEAPTNADLQAALARFIEKTDSEESIQRYQLAEANSKDLSVAAKYGLRAVQVMQQNHDVAAKTELERLVIRYPKDASIRLELAKSLADDKKYSEAIDQAKAVLVINPDAYPDGPLALQDMRQWAIDGDLTDKIVTTLRELAEKYPANATILYQLSAATGTQMEKMKAPANSSDPGWVYFKRMRKSHPESKAILWAMNDYSKRRGLNDERIALMVQEGKDDPKSPVAFGVLGTIYADQKNWDKAESAYREAIRRAPTEITYKIGLAKTLESAGKTKEALDAYGDAKKTDPTNKVVEDAIARLSAPPASDKK